jgi:myo-inositol 2-dehydrogenase/D-chiro-inositol 1-dehydrogenase
MRIGVIGVGRIGALHVATLRGLAEVESVIVTDADLDHAARIAAQFETELAGDVDDLLNRGLDGVLIATATASHPEMIRRGVAQGLPVFCEKPVAPDASGTRDVIRETKDATVQIGFQRRFDAGYRNARDLARQGNLGWLHTIRSTTLDPAPPPPGYIPGSGGIFRDCAVHDFDSIRWVTGHEVTSVYATGANRGEQFFRDAGDVDTASALLTMDDGTIALVSCTRYNAAGYDVRLELLGSRGSVAAGLDDRTPLRSAEPDATFPAGPPYHQFVDRFKDAYTAELAAFVDVVAGRATSPCTPDDALEAFCIAEAAELSRLRNGPVEIAEVRP